MQLSIQSRSGLKDRGSLALHQSSLILKEFAEEQGGQRNLHSSNSASTIRKLGRAPMVPEGQICQSGRSMKKDVRGRGRSAGIDAAFRGCGKSYMNATSYVQTQIAVLFLLCCLLFSQIMFTNFSKISHLGV